MTLQWQAGRVGMRALRAGLASSLPPSPALLATARTTLSLQAGNPAKAATALAAAAMLLVRAELHGEAARLLQDHAGNIKPEKQASHSTKNSRTLGIWLLVEFDSVNFSLNWLSFVWLISFCFTEFDLV